ncbi:unnamed protein product, partial [Rotaria sp. Silwood1]
STARICSNATWDQNAVRIVSSFWNSTYQFSPGDFGFDSADNLRVVAFSPGNPYARLLFSSSINTYYSSFYNNYHSGDLTLDNSGNIYVAGIYNITRWAPSTSTATSIVSVSYWSAPRLRLDSKGNLYIGAYFAAGIDKRNISTNIC